MRWIETDSFVGPDRRLIRKLRIIERRRVDLSVRAPSIAARLRQLRVQAYGAHEVSQRLALVRQISGTASLAGQLGEVEIASRLKALALRIEQSANLPVQAWLDEELHALAGLLSHNPTS